jgi:curved DNA-binding protein CbpA
MSSVQKDFYSILGVQDTAESVVIRAAYKALMMIYHPDKYPGDKQKAIKMSKDINEAYAVLIDPQKRKKHDAQRLSQSGRLKFRAETQTPKAVNELKKTLKESEMILDLLKVPTNLQSRFSDLHEFKSVVKEAEAILKLLNDPD